MLIHKASFCRIMWKAQYSRTPLIRPPSESHWCGRIRGMAAREGFIYEQKPLSVTRNVVVWEGWSLVRVVVRQGFYCTRQANVEPWEASLNCRKNCLHWALTDFKNGAFNEKHRPKTLLVRWIKIFENCITLLIAWKAWRFIDESCHLWYYVHALYGELIL